MNDDLEKICLDVLTEATVQQMGQKLSALVKGLMNTYWGDIIDSTEERRANREVLFSTIVIAIKFGLRDIAHNFAENARRGAVFSGPGDEKFNKLVDPNNVPKLADMVKEYLNEIFNAISSVDENALIDKYFGDGSNSPQNTEPNKTSVQQDAEMLARMRAAQAEPDESKRMKMLADIDAEIDRQKGKI